MLSDNGSVDQTIALRPEELDRICLKEKIWEYITEQKTKKNYLGFVGD
jgi:hypothetical protein